MVESVPTSRADHLLRVARSHPECIGGEVLAYDEVRLDIRVEMPLHMKDNGVSDTGVLTVEPVTLRVPPDYPWRSPRVELRADFPRDFPHLQPDDLNAPPRPCLVDGDQDEFFLQFGLVEYGLFHLLEQVAVWLRKAAISHLIDPKQGWEPTMRRGLNDILAFDAKAALDTAMKDGGYVTWRASFTRKGGLDVSYQEGVSTWIDSQGIKTPLSASDNSLFAASRIFNNMSRGITVMGIIWPDKPAAGGKRISDHYVPDDVTSLGKLRIRADTLGCRRGLELFFKNLERSLQSSCLHAPIPIGIILCIRRPFTLIGSDSSIELLPYVIEMRPFKGRSSLFPAGDDEQVVPAMHFQALTAGLLRNLSGAPERPPLAMLGCGSVGSKLAVHAARAGQSIVAVSDSSWIRPHNLARHALYPECIGTEKADALAKDLAGFGLSPLVYKGDIVDGLKDAKKRPQIIPTNTRVVVNATASLAVREAITAATSSRDRMRYIEAALFGRGRIGYLLIDGAQHNPNHNDLMAELYATLEDPDVIALLSDPMAGLSQIEIGQGCGSLTMIVDDAQLSMMTAGLAKEIGHAVDHPQKDGLIVTGISDAETPSTRWSRQIVSPFTILDIDGSDGWQLRISPRVVERIRREATSFAHAETGGLLIGLSSARLKTVTVVDVLDAPPDSRRSPTLFVLGNQGLQDTIAARHRKSSQTLFDVGTWHSHLTNVGPSSLDWSTAAELAAGRAPPSVLLIVTPYCFHALIAKGKVSG